MSSDKPARLYRTRRSFRWAVRLIALAAAVLTTALLAESTREGVGLPGCGGGGEGLFSGCGTVLGSGWSRWLGLPVALPGVAGYVAVFAAALFIGPGRPAAHQRRAWRALAGLTVMCGLSAAWFVVVQAAFLGAWCVYCTAVHAMGLTLLALVASSGHVGRTRSGPWAVAGVLPVIALVAGQVLGGALGDEGEGAVSALAMPRGEAAGVLSDSGPGPGRELLVAGGGAVVRMRPHAMPVLGSPDAERLAVYVYDYACEHCRAMQPLLGAALSRYNGGASGAGDDAPRLGVVLVPAPLPGACDAAAADLACRAATAVLLMAGSASGEASAWHKRFLADDLAETVPAWESARAFPRDAVDEAVAQRDRNGRLRELLGGVAPQLLIGRLTIRGRVEREAELFELLDPLLVE